MCCVLCVVCSALLLCCVVYMLFVHCVCCMSVLWCVCFVCPVLYVSNGCGCVVEWVGGWCGVCMLCVLCVGVKCVHVSVRM